MTQHSPTRILFICLGNICRSPAAHGVMQHMIDERGLSALFHVDSAGMGNWHAGQLPDSRMRRHGQMRGYVFDHHARQFNAPNDFDHFDMIVTMDDDNYRAVTSLARNDADRQKVVKMSRFLKSYPQASSVPDPYYGGDRDFEYALDLIEDGCRNLLNHITCTSSSY